MKKNIFNIILVSFIALFLVGCSGGTSSSNTESTVSKNDNTEESKADGATNQDVTVVLVGVGNAAPPFTYLDENGELAGYDVEVLKIIDERLDQYEFDYQPMEFKTLLTAIESGQVAMGAHNISKNPERKEMFMFTEEPTLTSQYYILTMADNDFNPNSLTDLEGHSVYSKIGSEDATMIEEHNAQSDGEDIEIVFGEQGDDLVAQSLQNGETDAKIASFHQFIIMNDSFGDTFKRSEDPLFEQYGYVAFNKEQADLKAAVDEVVAELIADGTLDEIYAQEVEKFGK